MEGVCRQEAGWLVPGRRVGSRTSKPSTWVLAEISKETEGAARLLLVSHGEIQEEITNLRKELLNGNEPEFDKFRNSQPIYIAKKNRAFAVEKCAPTEGQGCD